MPFVIVVASDIGAADTRAVRGCYHRSMEDAERELAFRRKKYPLFANDRWFGIYTMIRIPYGIPRKRQLDDGGFEGEIRDAERAKEG